jgi:O-antigen/teichoic acid export membrane protein
LDKRPDHGATWVAVTPPPDLRLSRAIESRAMSGNEAAVVPAVQPLRRRLGLLSVFSATGHVAARQSALLFGASIISRALGVLRGVVVARLLAPQDFGLLASMLVAASYLQMVELGVGWGTVREIPLLRGRTKTAEVVQLEREVFWWEILIGVTVGVVIAAYLLQAGFESTSHARAWLALPIYVGAELLRNTLTCFLQAREEFSRLRRSIVWLAVVDLALAIVLTTTFGLTGAAAALPLTSVGLIGALLWDARASRLWMPTRLRWPTFRLLIGVGFPLMIQNMMWSNMTNVDKVIILSALDTEALAYYAMAQTIAASMLLVSGAVARVNGPRMIRRFAETDDPKALYGMLVSTVQVLAYGLPVLVTGMWLVGPAFFALVLPKYMASVPLLNLTTVSFYAMGITLGVSAVYIALERQVLNGFLLLGGMVLTVGLSLVFMATGWGALGVAAASAISSCTYLVVFLIFGFRMVGRRGPALVSDLARTLLPLAVCLAAAVVLGNVPPAGPGRLWGAAAIALGTAVLAVWGISTSLHSADLRS